jgi:hypothetical protein
MTADNPVRRYMARVEFLACKETIDSMLAQGFSKKLIHERLTSDGRCSMHYITFCEFIRNAERNIPPVKPVKATPSPTENRQPSPAFPQRQPGIIRAESKTFPDPRTMNPNDSY